MPVPVPPRTNPIAHPVLKQTRSNDTSYSSDLKNLAPSLSVSHTAPPPSFGSRDQCIHSLPSWRRAKPRRIWEEDALRPRQRNFPKGLIVAEDAAIIKGQRAQACIPPLCVLLQSLGVPSQPPANMHAFPFGTIEGGLVGGGCGRLVSDAMEEDPINVSVKVRSTDYFASDISLIKHGKPAGSPISGDDSPGNVEDDGSSPLEPITPFSEFVNHAVSTPTYPHGGVTTGPIVRDPYYAIDRSVPCPQLQECLPMDIPKELVPAPVVAPEVVTPSASPGYRKLAEPLAEWVVSYVWRVCTTGFSLPPKFSMPSSPRPHYPSSPPSHLTASVHSLFLSTLLQPSAVFLALWYIVHLPAYFDAVGLEGPRESAFRITLFALQSTGFGLENRHSSAPFRLIVLGCMLANKWLDDHTFSNKTWHTISNVPINILNSLESLALAIFSHDLSVPPHEWNRWLSHVQAYHCSLSSPSRPQPISRPSSNPHSIVRKAIDEIICAAPSSDLFPQPIFLGLEARRKEKLDRELVLDIDLDEDGPLREEYIPKRRASRMGLAPGAHYDPPTSEQVTLYPESHTRNSIASSPSKWSPSSGEPIVRERNTSSGHYIAVQPSLAPAMPSYHHVRPHYQPYPCTAQWSGYMDTKVPSHSYDGFSITNQPPNPLNPYPLGYSAASHSRSLSVSLDQDQSRTHLRSYSQSHFDYRWSNLRLTANEAVLPHRELSWTTTHCPYGYPTQSFVPPVTTQSAWLRT